MTSIPLNCDRFAEAMADYLERDDTPRIRAAVEAHAASCAECGALLSDVQQLRVDASGLPTLTPSRDLWSGIAERIEAPVLALGQVRGPRSNVQGDGVATKRVPNWLRPAAAAAALVFVTAGVTYFATRQALLSNTQVADSASLDPRKMVAQAFDSARRAEGIPLDHTSRANPRARGMEQRTPGVGPRPTSRAPQTAPFVAVLNQPPVAEAVEPVYGREIDRLWRIVDERRALLDTATVGVIERNLIIIDQAIRDSRAALTRDPASAFLNEQLNNALERKIELLRAAALLPVRS